MAPAGVPDRPRLPEPSWLAPRSRGRQGLDRALIVQAALNLVATDGFDALTMRRLGTELEAGATSLYWHVRDKAQLVELVIDEVIGQIDLPTKGDWRTRTLELATNARNVLLAYPGAAQQLVHRGTTGPNAMIMHDFALGLLAEAGVAAPLLWDTYVSLLTYLVGQVLGETWSAPETDPERGAALVQWLASIPDGVLPNVMAAAAHQRMGFQERFIFGLNCFLDGLEGSSVRRPEQAQN